MMIDYHTNCNIMCRYYKMSMTRTLSKLNKIVNLNYITVLIEAKLIYIKKYTVIKITLIFMKTLSVA